MNLSTELLDIIIRFGFNISVIFIIVKLVYQRNHPNNLDFVFTYFMFNTLIFFFAFSLASIKIDIGFAFGMFAVFAILRYRTDPIPIKEMTYLFIAIAVGVINALSGTQISYGVLLFTNITLIILTYLLEMYWQRNALIIRVVEYEIIDNIKPKNHEKLLLDLESRIGMPILRFEIGRINFLRDTVRISIYCRD
tara:strand:+ start:313 stop:894 length:582 start_codon:yes stop_codon:yes gene_type:complete